MGLFGLITGRDKKLPLIRELIRKRYQRSGGSFAFIQAEDEIDRLGTFELLASPEGTIVTIVETIVQLQKKGGLFTSVLLNIEGHRARGSSDKKIFSEIIQKYKLSGDVSQAVLEYCIYRVALEHPNTPGCDAEWAVEAATKACELYIM
jgi:hypothetical protein